MSEATVPGRRVPRGDIMARHREIYLRSGGAEGHIMDLSFAGGHVFTTHCMIRYVGRKSGRIFITPLIYGDIGGEVVIVASKGGADAHPAWYLNIRDRDELDFQVATNAFRATKREPQGEERARIWAFMAAIFPSYTAYQGATDRLIPLVMMKPVEAIPVFRESDATGMMAPPGAG